MDYIDYDKLISFDVVKLSFNERRKIFVPFFLYDVTGYIDSIVKINNCDYCYKEVNNYEMLNELIGSYLCKLINLNAVDYKVGFYNEKIYALSKVLYEDKYNYTNCRNYLNSIPITKLSLFKSIFGYFKYTSTYGLNGIDDSSMILDILKLISLDLKMGQVDRYNWNLVLKVDKETDKVSLAPIYDFSLSYQKDYFSYCNPGFYVNPFVVLRRNGISLSSFSKKYPEIRDVVKSLVDISIVDVINDISKNNGIVLTTDEINYYNNKDKEYSNLLRKML